jgi:hypothetical protein
VGFHDRTVSAKYGSFTPQRLRLRVATPCR